MIDPVSFLVLTVLVVGLSQIVLPTNRFARLLWATVPGAFLLLITHPRALGLAVGSLLAATTVFAVGRHVRSDRLRAGLPYLILLLLFVPDLAVLTRESHVLFLGSAFFVVRQMTTVARSLKERIGPRSFVPALLLATFFFAALPSGPVFNGVAVWDELGERRSPEHGPGIYRLFEGFVHLFALGGFADAALELARSGTQGAIGQWLVVPLSAFAVLFTTFYGYSRMAEGTALLLGFSVPQNFDRPHKAADLGDYWKRWHRSMADFVMQYIYLPLLVTTRRSKLALLAAFVFMGLWHNLSPAFLVWGVGHGFGLAVVLPWARRRHLPSLVMRSATLVWVIALSGVAHEVWR